MITNCIQLYTGVIMQCVQVFPSCLLTLSTDEVLIEVINWS